MAVDQQWALNSLRHIRNSAVLTLSGLVLLNSDAVHTLNGRLVLLRPGEIILNAGESDRTGPRLELPLSQIPLDYAKNYDNYLASLKEQRKYARRNIVKESVEVAKAYCGHAGCLEAFKAAPWYPFAKILRNSISHDMHFRFNRHDLSTLPVSYRGITLDAILQDSAVLET